MDCDAGLSVIPDDLSALSKLQRLRLDSCKGIKHIPSCLASLKSLRELSLNDTNGLIHVDSINNLKLNKLSLRFVRLCSCCLCLSLPFLLAAFSCLSNPLPSPVYILPSCFSMALTLLVKDIFHDVGSACLLLASRPCAQVDDCRFLLLKSVSHKQL